MFYAASASKLGGSNGAPRIGDLGQTRRFALRDLGLLLNIPANLGKAGLDHKLLQDLQASQQILV